LYRNPPRSRGPEQPGSDHARLRRHVFLTWLSIALTLTASVMLARDVNGGLQERIRLHRTPLIFEQIVFIAIVYFLIYGNLVYQAARLGYLKRRMAHKPADRATLERIYDLARRPALSVLVPSYREEPRLVRQTLLSAALMEYPGHRVVLLIDDPPEPSDLDAAAALVELRELPGRIRAFLDAPARRFEVALARFRERQTQGRLEIPAEAFRLASLYIEAAEWLDRLADDTDIEDHTDVLFVKGILREPARAHRERAAQLTTALEPRNPRPSQDDIAREYRRLASLFLCELTSFERKRFVNLSHEPNKAMNLNSYIALIGGSFRKVVGHDGLHLEPCKPELADLRVPDADYLITLDADSLLLNDYALRLGHIMEQPHNRRVAVAQTPYSAVPGTANMLERVAGATTDIQHIIHQGSSAFRAAYWVGANAMLRRAALEDICEFVVERGYRIARFIQDRTVIEDTESTVDLISRGWHLHNYPDRLAYSATPPDFGALIIQRRRWANGGLIILPKLLRYLARGPARVRKMVAESWMRVHYLTSLTTTSVGMLALLFHPFERSMYSYWLPVTAAGYYILYGFDLVDCGYDWADLLRVYALNLMLLPISLGGVLKSLHQAWTGSKTPFGRTPKVRGRTGAPPMYISFALALPVYCAARGLLNLANRRILWAAFLLFNGAFLAYACLRFVGLREAMEDLGLVVQPAPQVVQPAPQVVQPAPQEVAAERALASEVRVS
jgi:cellulose synthase/poly-beta-1,6-N-acetylglucosamine synthase-like glycosyltransferase